VADQIAALIVAAKHLPAIASDRFFDGDAGQGFRGPVPRDDREVGGEREESIAGTDRLGRPVSHDASLQEVAAPNIRSDPDRV
jgi:hypothetical protein